MQQQLQIHVHFYVKPIRQFHIKIIYYLCIFPKPVYFYQTPNTFMKYHFMPNTFIKMHILFTCIIINHFSRNIIAFILDLVPYSIYMQYVFYSFTYIYFIPVYNTLPYSYIYLSLQYLYIRDHTMSYHLFMPLYTFIHTIHQHAIQSLHTANIKHTY